MLWGFGTPQARERSSHRSYTGFEDASRGVGTDATTSGGLPPRRVWRAGCVVCVWRGFGATPLVGLTPEQHRAIWLILPVVICLFQGLSHACLRVNGFTVGLRMAHYISTNLSEKVGNHPHQTDNHCNPVANTWMALLTSAIPPRGDLRRGGTEQLVDTKTCARKSSLYR